MAKYQKIISISDNKNVNSMTTFAALFVAIFIVMASFGVIAAGSMNETAPEGITYPVLAADNPAMVDLGTAADFTVLAKTGISTTAGTLVTGDIGVSSAAGTLTGPWVLSLDASGEFSTSPLVTGNVYAFDYAVPTPAKMTTAVGDMGTAYTEASGRVNGIGVPDFSNEGSGILEGLTLYPGIHKWSTPVSIGVTVPGDVTLDGDGNPDSVFIFQISGTLNIGSGADVSSGNKVLLTNGASASNIFWTVAGAVTLGTYSTFEGNVLTGATSLIAIQTGAVLNGRALSDGAVTLDANSVTEPSPIAATAPVSSVDTIIPYWNNTGTLDITANGTDCDSIELYYRYSVDNTTWGGWTLFDNDTASPWEWAFNFPDGNGYYEFYTRGWNDADGVREDAPLTADAISEYDDVELTSACVVAGAYWRNTGPVVINATASDATSGIASVALYYRYGAVNGSFGAWTLSSTDIMAPWSFSFAFASGQGYYEFYTIATDNATNMESAPGSADVRYGYDNVAPTSSANAISPYVTVTSPKTITATAADATSGLASVDLWYAYSAANVTFGAYINFGTDVASPWSWNFNFPAGTGYYRFHTRATDNAANAELAPVAADTSTLYDSAGPTIVSTTPMNGSVGISINPGTYVIQFNEAMDNSAGTIQTNLPGTFWNWSTNNVWYNGTYASLQLDTTYYVNLTGFTDMAANALTGDMKMSFTTADMLGGSTRLPVNLGTAEDFVVLAKTAVTTTGSTLITGDVGISPAAASYITGFGLILDSSTTFSTSSLVVGKVYAADYTPPTPTKMTTAISDMETAYTDAAGRTIPDYVELGAGDITGMTLSPGLYKWDTGLLISAGGVTLSGNQTAVWIFQIGIDFTVANGAIITLSGGARSYNIFWQVAGEVSIGTTVAMKGVILCQTQIVIKTGASFLGRALSQTQVTIDGNIITDPKDTTAPMVSSTVPANVATGVAINSAMTATFNEAMDPMTLNATTFTLKQGTTPVSGTVTYSGFTATFKSTVNLAASTTYTATITTGAKDLAGNALASNYTWTFTTGAVPDTTPPTVSSTVPANAATGVTINSAMTATFSEAMDVLTITNTTFTLKQGATPIPGGVTYVDFTGTFRPDANLAPNTTYTATITTGAKDLAGNALASNYVWSFTTGAAPDTTPPTVSSTIPANGATDVNINTAITATFSEAMNPLTITAASFILKQGTTQISGAVTYSGVTAIFTPTFDLLQFNTTYTATITTLSKDLAGNALARNFTWDFTTCVIILDQQPTITFTIPINNAIYVPINSAVTATFSEAMNPLTITTTTFLLAQGVTPISGTVTYSLVSAVFTPSSNLANNTVYTATITTGAKDLEGNALAANYVWNFTTGSFLDIIAPMVTSTVPANGATNVDRNNAITATFSEAMNPLTITTTTFKCFDGALQINGTVSYAGLTATFSPYSFPDPIPPDTINFKPNTTYTATITTGVKDLAGNEMENDYVWSWTTGETLDTTAPTITSTINENGATDVPINTKVGATFSEAMNPLTITTVTFTLKQGTTPVSGTVTYSLVTAVFTPLANLAPNTVYTATITTGAKDLAGNAMASNYVWSWTTGDAPDTTAPTVVSTVPANSATGVAINSAMSATFSEAMDPLTITTVTFTLKQGTTPVSGTVTYSLVTAVFSPLANLASSTVYTATITTGAHDLAGNALASNYVWSFTTGAVVDTTPPTITSTINDNGATDVPINTKVGATFSEAMDPLTITTVTFTLKQGTTPVSGTVTYSLVSAVFTPLANLAHNTVYTATITTGAKDLAGNAMASNYVWSWTTGDAPDTTAPTVVSTVPANAATDVAINSAMSATFSEAMDPLTITTITFTLKQGTTPVSGTVTYSLVTAVFTPLANLASSTVYTATITTGAKDLAGNALASNYVWSFTTGAVADTTPPTITATINDNGETGVPINTKVGATFSEAMDPLTITTVTFTLKQGTTSISGTVTYSGVNAVFTPSSNLAPNKVYTATITTGAKDLAGNAMASNYVWSWTTGDAPDTTAPTVVSTVPANTATGVAINSAMSATFSEAMDHLTITTVTFTLKQGTTSVSGTVTYSLVTAVFTPLANLASSTVYTATITTGAKDLAGNAMASNYVWSFTTGAAADTTAPTVISTVNADGATNVATNTRIAATFSEAMNPLTITTVTFTLKHGTTPVSGTVTYSGVTAVFTPTSVLAANTEYTCTITTGAKDLAGNAMASNYVWSWTTGASLDTTAPTVVSTVPANAATGVVLSSVMTATFSEAMNPLTITTITFTLKQGTTAVAGTVTYAGNTATFNPAGNLADDTVYTATITTGAKDLAGNALATNYVWSFDTSPAIIPPTTGTIIGVVVDENGEPIEGAIVSLGSTGTNATTNATGHYSFSDVAPGTYTLGFNASGYEPTNTTVTVTAGETTTVPDTVMVPEDGGAGNWWWILLVVAVIAAVALIGYTLMNKNKKSGETPPEQADAGAEPETAEQEGQGDAGAAESEPSGQEGDAGKEG
jgi:hypothetical protein